MSEEEEERVRVISRVRELFHGRFTKHEVIRLLDNHDWNYQEAVDFVLTSDPNVVRQLFTERSERDIVGLRECEVLRHNAERDKIPNRKRQFACEACDSVWWTRVPRRKPVSKCNKCYRKFDAVPEDEEYGWATFKCVCGNEFSGYGQIHVTTSECYRCHALPVAVSVRPPEYRGDRRTRSRHSCSAPDCAHHSTGQPPRGNERQNGDYGGRGGRGARGYAQGQNQVVYYGAVNPPMSFNGGDVLYQRGDPQRPDAPPGYHPGPPDANRRAGPVYYPNTCVHPESREKSGKKKVIVPSIPHRSSGSTVDSLMLDDDEASSVISGYQPSVDNIPEDPNEDNEEGSSGD
ncbi:shiftless antiviral inhibitor of ribosomal frameshifting protein homolog isoform X1 [Crassostrea virginica]